MKFILITGISGNRMSKTLILDNDWPPAVGEFITIGCFRFRVSSIDYIISCDGIADSISEMRITLDNAGVGIYSEDQLQKIGFRNDNLST